MQPLKNWERCRQLALSARPHRRAQLLKPRRLHVSGDVEHLQSRARRLQERLKSLYEMRCLLIARGRANPPILARAALDSDGEGCEAQQSWGLRRIGGRVDTEVRQGVKAREGRKRFDGESFEKECRERGESAEGVRSRSSDWVLALAAKGSELAHFLSE